MILTKLAGYEVVVSSRTSHYIHSVAFKVVKGISILYQGQGWYLIILNGHQCVSYVIWIISPKIEILKMRRD